MRRLIMPILRLLVAVVIAIALVKLAFFNSPAEEKAKEPWADFSPSTVVANVGDISQDLLLDGSVVVDPATDLKATAAGKVARFEVADGDYVEVGAPLLTVTRQEQGEPTEERNEEGQVTTTPGQTETIYGTIYANASGKVKFSVLQGQELTIGTPVGSISPETLSIQANLTPAQRYRMTAVPESATITVTPGPAPFDCHNLTISTPTESPKQGPAPAPAPAPEGGGPAPGDSAGSQQTSATISCGVPGEITVYPGMAAKMAMHMGDATGVLLVPITAVKGDYESGAVWKVVPGQEPQRTQVQLGLSDGLMVEVKSGLQAGDEILEFIPGQEKELDPYAEMDSLDGVGGEGGSEGGGSEEPAPVEDAPADKPADTEGQ